MRQTRRRNLNRFRKTGNDGHIHRSFPGSQEALRRRAEAALTGDLASTEQLSDAEVQHLIHELQVHQIELEMQNEALRQTQEALETARDRYFDLFNLAPVGYLVLSKKGGILEANLASARLLGMEQNRLMDRALSDFIYREDQDVFYLHSRQALQKNSRQEFDLRLVRNDGSQIDVHMECVRAEDQDLPGSQMRVMLNDITVRKQQEQALKIYADRLSISNRGLESFASIVSHDLQEPLRKINVFGELLTRDYSPLLDDKGQDYIDRMQKAASRMGNLIHDLLALSRLSTQVPAFQEVNLNSIVGEILEDLEIQIRRSGGQVEIGELPVLMAEPTLMQQLFQNLIANALKYHKPEIPPLVKVQVEQRSPQRVEIQVADNGIGFEQQAVNRIFDPFVRLHPRSAYEGTGIGLAICRRIVELHAGQITAYSTPGQGARFVVQLPLQQPDGVEG